MAENHKPQRGNNMENLPSWVYIIATFITTLLGGSGVKIFLNWKENKNKLKSESRKTDTESDNLDAQTEAQKIDNLFRIMDRMEDDYNCLLERMKGMEEEIERLKKQIQSNETDMGVLRSQLKIERGRKEYCLDGWRTSIGQLVTNEIEPEMELPSWAIATRS